MGVSALVKAEDASVDTKWADEGETDPDSLMWQSGARLTYAEMLSLVSSLRGVIPLTKVDHA